MRLRFTWPPTDRLARLRALVTTTVSLSRPGLGWPRPGAPPPRPCSVRWRPPGPNRWGGVPPVGVLPVYELFPYNTSGGVFGTVKPPPGPELVTASLMTTSPPFCDVVGCVWNVM